MKEQKSSSHIAPAAIVTVIGAALLLVFSFIGRYIKDGDMGMGLIWSVLFTAVLVGLVYFARYAKSRNSDLMMWRIVEAATLVVFIGVAVVASVPVVRFMTINADRAKVKQVAQDDIAHMRDVLTQFEKNETGLVERTAIGLENADKSKSKTNGLIIFKDEFNKEFLEDVINLKYNKYDSVLQNMDRVVGTWKLFKLPNVVRAISSYDSIMPQELSEFALEYAPKHPTIKANSDGIYDVYYEIVPETYSNIGVRVPALILGSVKPNVLSVVVIVLIMVMILFRYLMAFRSRSLNIKPGSATDDGGILLDF